MSTSTPLPGPLPDRVWWGTDASPITQAWECPQPASEPPPAVPTHTAEGWKRAARPHACAPVSAAASPQRLQRCKSFCLRLFKQLASRLQQPPRRRLPVTRPPSGLCRQGGPGFGAAGRRGRAPGSGGGTGGLLGGTSGCAVKSARVKSGSIFPILVALLALRRWPTARFTTEGAADSLWAGLQL